jgi:hypothetical protein
MAVFPIALPVEAPETAITEPESEPEEGEIEEPATELAPTEVIIEEKTEETEEIKEPEIITAPETEDLKTSEKPEIIKTPEIKAATLVDLESSKIEPKSASAEKPAQKISLPMASSEETKSTEEKIFPWQPLLATLLASVGLIWIFFQKK